MVLVDSSVWIRALAGKLPDKDELDQLLAKEQVIGHELVYGELLIGDCGGRTEFLKTYLAMHQARTVSHEEVVQFVRKRKLNGHGVGWIDVHLMASALVERLRVWTVDPRFGAQAQRLGVSYKGVASGGTV